MLGSRKRTEQALAEMWEEVETVRANYKEFRDWAVNILMRLDRELGEEREANAELEKRLDALERAHWHKGIENNCTECREIWNK